MGLAEKTELHGECLLERGAYRKEGALSHYGGTRSNLREDSLESKEPLKRRFGELIFFSGNFPVGRIHGRQNRNLLKDTFSGNLPVGRAKIALMPYTPGPQFQRF